MQWGYNAPADPQRYTTLPHGTYDAELVSYEEKVSSKGNSMIELTLKVYGTTDREYQIRDWLVNTDGMAWKIKSFVTAVGQTYGLPIDFDKATGKLFQVKIKEEPNTYNGETKMQNRVDDYYPAAKNSVRPATASEAGIEIPDSALPF